MSKGVGTPRLRLKPLAEQVLLITGASSGIGLVTAKLAAERGARVMLVAREKHALSRAVNEIIASGGTADFAVADVGELDQVQRAATAAIARFGRIDSWVNNAGVAIYAKLVDTPMDEHERMLRTNYLGAVHGSLVAIEHLRQNGGALITVGSIAADIPSPIMGAYAATKHAVRAYTSSLRIELSADAVPIAVTLIKPAGIDTPIAQHATNHQAGEALIPPPIYDPALVAEAILDAAQNVRREVTVGGIGRLQVLLSQHFPRVLDRLGKPLAAMLQDTSSPPTTSNNLDRPVGDDLERSGQQSGRKVSFYGTPRSRKLLATSVAGATALGVLALIGRRRLGDGK